MLSAALIIALDAGSPSPTASPIPSAVPTAPVTSPTPAAAPTPGPVAAPSPPGSSAPPAPRPIPSAALTPAPYLYSYVPPASIPPSKILEIDLNDRQLHAPGEVRVRVLTSNDIVSVIIRAMGREIAVPRIIPGLFAAEDRIPHVPFFLRGRIYDVEFVAASADGQTTTISLQIELAR